MKYLATRSFCPCLLLLSSLTVACGASEAEAPASPDAGLLDGDTESEAGLPGDCEDAVFYDPNDDAASATPTQLVACFAASKPQAVRVDLTGSPVSGRLDEPCTPGAQQAQCHDDCQSDTDCGPGALCTAVARITRSGEVARGWSRRGNQCLPAECSSPADCGGRACGASFSTCGVLDGYYCRTGSDECQSDLDCEGVTRGCRYLDGRFRCAMTASCE